MIDGLFDIENRLNKLSKTGDPLLQLSEIIPWEEFRSTLEVLREKERKSKAGRKPFDVTLMFKILVLQSLYNLSDDAMEYQINDRLSFMRFLQLSLGAKVPDAKTIWLFRNELTEAQLTKVLFDQFDSYLQEHGFNAKKGQIVDASIVKVPIQRNSKDENKKIKSGEKPSDWSTNKARQKDLDARWTKKNNKSYYGYKNHIQIDVEHKFIRNYKTTEASLHDSQVFEELLSENNTSRAVWADSAYRSKDSLEKLKNLNFRPYLQRKGFKNKKLTKWEQQGNKTRSKTRSRVEHIFGIQTMMARGNLILRSIGSLRAQTSIGMRNLAYNMHRFSSLVSS
jgi:transposase, IS5 family